ncbi:unnamed protein product, partial [Meganyctiphanes norvegica]
MIHSMFVVYLVQYATRCVFVTRRWNSSITKNTFEYFTNKQYKCNHSVYMEVVIIANNSTLYPLIMDSENTFKIRVWETLDCLVYEGFFHHKMVKGVKEFLKSTGRVSPDLCDQVVEPSDEELNQRHTSDSEYKILELLRPQNIFDAVAVMVVVSGNVVKSLRTGQYLWSVAWRRKPLRCGANVANYDIHIKNSFKPKSEKLRVQIDCCIKLTGMPDLTLTFINPRLFDDVSFHPCVRLKRWESERMLSFVPPDGNFRLLSYHIGSQSVVAIPLYIRHNISFRDVGGGRCDITVGPKQTMGRTVEQVVIEVPMPKCVLNCNLTVTQGKYSFDPVSKVLRWDVGRIDPSKLPNIRGNISIQSGAPNPESNPNINVSFTISQLAVSGLKVNRLDIYGEKYKPFKGVKYITRAGKFQVRT